MKRHRKYGNIPQLKLERFVPSWKSWWGDLQPKWRGAWPHRRQVPPGETWAGCRRGGKNGFFIVLISLAWWSVAVETGTWQEKAAFADALEDVRWVASQLVNVRSEGQSDGASHGTKKVTHRGSNKKSTSSATQVDPITPSGPKTRSSQRAATAAKGSQSAARVEKRVRGESEGEPSDTPAKK